MLDRLRRRRWIAALLIALSPALAGGVLPLLHPCPVDMPWLAAAADRAPGPSAADHRPSEHGSSHHDEHQTACNCVGGCHIPQVVGPAVDAPVAALVHATPAVPAWPVVERGGDARPILEHLPEATAPPLA